MTLLDFLILLLIAGICGALGQAIAGFSRGGCLVSIALGFVGAVCRSFLPFGSAPPTFPLCGRSSAPRCSWPSLRC